MIASFRARYSQLTSSIKHYEAIVAEHSAQLHRMHQSGDHMEDASDNENESVKPASSLPFTKEAEEITEDDLAQEEEEIRELEKKKRALEERVNGMDRDLGGLLR